ncbi:MAG: hypothetical protein R3B74_07885 [Nitrospirales bacterium]|nr:hypothetical protein [Nitrospirales bacterium]
MTRVFRTGLHAILLIGILISVGCHGPHALVNFYNSDPDRDQRFIVAQYYRQAVFMVKNAEDMRLKAERYAQLFGSDSEWVSSAKWLENYYEKESLDREQLAVFHAESVKSHSHSARLEAR